MNWRDQERSYAFRPYVRYPECVSQCLRARSEPEVVPSLAPVELGGEIVARKQQQESVARSLDHSNPSKDFWRPQVSTKSQSLRQLHTWHLADASGKSWESLGNRFEFWTTLHVFSSLLSYVCPYMWFHGSPYMCFLFFNCLYTIHILLMQHTYK